MYTVDTNIKDLQVKERPLARLFFSLNSPMIATPELGTEEARCYIMLFKEGSAFASYIGLYLPNSDRRFFYVYSGNPVAESGLNDLLDESNRFGEEMGFLLDELNLDGMSADERNKWIDEQPFFGYCVKKAEEKQWEEPVETEAVKPAEAAETQREEPAEQPAAMFVEAAPPPAETAPAPEVIPAPLPATPATEEQPPPETKLEEALDLPEVAPAAPEEPEIQDQPALKQSPVHQKKTRLSSPPQPVPEEEGGSGEGKNGDEEAAPQPYREAAIRVQKRQKKNQLSPTGTVNKEYEALARLLSSF